MEPSTSIILPSGQVVWFDLADAPLVKQYAWHRLKTPWGDYAQAHVRGARGKKVLMHRLLMGFPGLTVDHRDRDGLNNRRANLREATGSQQNYNRRAQRKRASISSRFKGVYWAVDPRSEKRKRGYWFAKVVIYGRQIVRSAPTEEDAALWYNALALKHFGDFANLNEVTP